MSDQEKRRVGIPLSGDERTNFITLTSLVIAFQAAFNEACLGGDMPKSARLELADRIERKSTIDLKNLDADGFHPDHEINGKKQALLIIGGIVDNIRKTIAQLP